jgi:hypothetical protein
MIRATLAIAAILSAAPCAHSAEVRVPFTIDYVTIRAALIHQVYTAPGERAAPWNGADSCQYVYAEKPSLARAGDFIRIETAATLALGLEIAGNCISPIEWSGIAQADTSPYVASGLKLKFRVGELNLLDSNHEHTEIVSRAFDAVKMHLIPPIEAFSYDLHPAVDQLESLAEAASPPVAADRLRASIATLRADPTVTATDNGVRVTLLITVPDFAAQPTGTPSPLTPEEIAAFTKLVDQWDSFLVFAMKQAGGASADRQFRDELLAILLDSRTRLVGAVANPTRASAQDPVRELFVDDWSRLHEAIRAAAQRGTLGSRGLEFLSFVSAADALIAFDSAAPALGMKISADDLRALARIIAPAETADPLKFDFAEDADLQSIFGVPVPAQIPGPIDESGEAASPPTASPTATPPSHSMLRVPDWLYEPALADAAELGEHRELTEVGLRMRTAVVSEQTNIRYRDDMKRLLELTSERELEGWPTGARYGSTYRIIVKSTAWQESCWRQFVIDRGRVRWLESSTGDVGLMQVNKYVWRGMYSLERLKWDVLYNAGAGAEILIRMIEYAISHAHSPMSAEALARSAYAAYNGGPFGWNRWQRETPTPIAAIDRSYLKKYRAIGAGSDVDIMRCAADWGRQSLD